MAKVIRKQWVYPKIPRTLPRRDDRYLAYDYDAAFDEAVKSFPDKIPKEQTPKLWLAWVHRELDGREKESHTPNHEDTRHRLKQLFGNAKPGEMQVFKVNFSKLATRSVRS